MYRPVVSLTLGEILSDENPNKGVSTLVDIATEHPRPLAQAFGFVKIPIFY
jgi:hypothetical protein